MGSQFGGMTVLDKRGPATFRSDVLNIGSDIHIGRQAVVIVRDMVRIVRIDLVVDDEQAIVGGFIQLRLRWSLHGDCGIDDRFVSLRIGERAGGNDIAVVEVAVTDRSHGRIEKGRCYIARHQGKFICKILRKDGLMIRKRGSDEPLCKIADLRVRPHFRIP